MKKKQVDFIMDASRQAALNAIEAHRKTGDSLVIVGEYGIGKSELLKQVPRPFITVNSYAKAHQILGRIIGEKHPRYDEMESYVEKLIEKPRDIMVDEMQDLPPSIYKYIKPLMDAGNVFIFASRPEMMAWLDKKHADVLSRLTPVRLLKLSVDDIYPHYSDVDRDAFETAYNMKSNTRELATLMKNCRAYAASNSIKTIDADVIMKFMPELGD